MLQKPGRALLAAAAATAAVEHESTVDILELLYIIYRVRKYYM